MFARDSGWVGTSGFGSYTDEEFLIDHLCFASTEQASGHKNAGK
jgi:hypothetical protein